MSSKTNTDLIRELGLNVAILGEQLDQLKAKLESIEAALARTETSLVESQIRLAVQESRQADLKAANDEKDRRRWAVWPALLGSVLTLIVNLALIFPKR